MKHPKQQKYIAALIGCGNIAGGYDESSPLGLTRTHIRAYRAHPQVTVSGACDSHLAKAERFCRIWDIPLAYDSVDALCEQVHPTIVSVCTPDDSHAPILTQLLRYPSIRAVWCEKPLPEYRAAVELVSAYRQQGVALLVNYQRAWEREHRRLAEAIRTGTLGRIQTVTAYYTKGIVHNGSHLIHLLATWFGRPSSVQVTRCHPESATNDPTIDAVLEFGSVRVYLIGLSERFYSLFEVDVMGETMRCQIRAGGDEIAWSDVVDDPAYPGYRVLQARSRKRRTDLGRAMSVPVRQIVERLSGDLELSRETETALLVSEICSELLQSLPK